jgi:hypothetical protein
MGLIAFLRRYHASDQDRGDGYDAAMFADMSVAKPADGDAGRDCPELARAGIAEPIDTGASRAPCWFDASRKGVDRR